MVYLIREHFAMYYFQHTHTQSLCFIFSLFFLLACVCTCGMLLFVYVCSPVCGHTRAQRDLKWLLDVYLSFLSIVFMEVRSPAEAELMALAALGSPVLGL